jgi:hypothetical protein
VANRTSSARFAWILLSCSILPIGSSLQLRGQTLSGLQIGDDESKTTRLTGKPGQTDTYKTFTGRKWNLVNGNDLSVTTSASGRIVYVESDWKGMSDETGCDLPRLRFGVTTLTELRKRLGSNGFGFKKRGLGMQTADGIVLFNAFEVGTAVVTFVTKVNLVEYRAAKDKDKSVKMGDFARLDAISIADPEYAKSEWGDRTYDPTYKPVTWK